MTCDPEERFCKVWLLLFDQVYVCWHFNHVVDGICSPPCLHAVKFARVRQPRLILLSMHCRHRSASLR